MSMIECRICENCGARNPVNVLECIQCSYDLSLVPPVKVEENASCNTDNTQTSSPKSRWHLTFKNDPSLNFDVSDTVVVGRDEEPLKSYSRTSSFISREHATMAVQDETLYVMDASTNGTFINGTRLKKMVQTPIHRGDVVTFADMDFDVQ